jgi:hypothetical protein
MLPVNVFAALMPGVGTVVVERGILVALDVGSGVVAAEVVAVKVVLVMLLVLVLVTVLFEVGR